MNSFDKIFNIYIKLGLFCYLGNLEPKNVLLFYLTIYSIYICTNFGFTAVIGMYSDIVFL